LSSTRHRAEPLRGSPDSRPLTVLYVVSLFPCWSETFIVREVQALVDLGVDVRILSLKPPSEALVQPEAAGLAARVVYARGSRATGAQLLRALPVMTAVTHGLRGHPAALAKSVVALWRAAGASRAAAAIAPRAIHAHWATYPSTAALLLSRLLGVPFSFTAHAHDIFVEDHLVAAKLRASAFAVTVSDFNRRLLERRYGAEARQKLRVIHCGIPLEQFPFQAGDRQPGAVVAVGRLDPIKGFPVLVDACGVLRDAGVTFTCDIVGDGPLRGSLAAQIAGRRLENQVRLRGAMAGGDLRRLLYTASVFALPSIVTPEGNMDGIPVALMEAMASGLPAVSTRVSGIPELVRDGSSGRLVAAGDAAALAGALSELLARPTLRIEFARAARRGVEESFDASRESARLHALFVEATRGSGVGQAAQQSKPDR
jgi:colanic acid/amylovoran biosynthesis glycosyltransferase